MNYSNLLLLLCTVSALTPSQVDLNKVASVQEAAKNIHKVLVGYYDRNKNGQGSIPQSNRKDASGFQWYEMGMFWGIVAEYMKTSGDTSLATTTTQALVLASYGKVKSFLGNSRSEGTAVTTGKWNDDILWWAMGPLVGAELFGPNTVMPGGVTYSELAIHTLGQTLAQKDDVCSGGIWWKRDQKDYKSVITNILAMNIAARVNLLNGDKQMNDLTVELFKWLKFTKIVSNRKVFDGLLSNRTGCFMNTDEYSYKSGTYVGALSWMSQSLKDPSYQREAEDITLNYAIQRFAPNGIVTDPCELTKTCELDRVTPKGGMIRGWGYVHEFASNDNVRLQLRNVLKTTVEAMLRTCDQNWNCGDDWRSRAPPKAYNVHYQMNAGELITAYLKTFTPGPVGRGINPKDAPTEVPKGLDIPPEKPSSSSTLKNMGLALTAFFTVLLF